MVSKSLKVRQLLPGVREDGSLFIHRSLPRRFDDFLRGQEHPGSQDEESFEPLPANYLKHRDQAAPWLAANCTPIRRPICDHLGVSAKHSE